MESGKRTRKGSNPPKLRLGRGEATHEAERVPSACEIRCSDRPDSWQKDLRPRRR